MQGLHEHFTDDFNGLESGAAQRVLYVDGICHTPPRPAPGGAPMDYIPPTPDDFRDTLMPPDAHDREQTAAYQAVAKEAAASLDGGESRFNEAVRGYLQTLIDDRVIDHMPDVQAPA